MTDSEKIKLIENAIEADRLTPETRLENIETWDSMARLSLLSMFSAHFHGLDVEKLASFQTIGDILNEMTD